MGGGEVYTYALTRALLDEGAAVSLYVHPANRFWDNLPVRKVAVEDASALERALPQEAALVVAHTNLPAASAERIAARHRLVGFAHMPLLERAPGWLTSCELVVTVSRYCLGLLANAGVARIYPEPFYGVADPARGDPAARLLRRSPYQWDRRKLRDVVLGRLEPAAQLLTPSPAYERRPGLTLGVVSMIAPIKQFPAFFSCTAPVLARHGVNLEIFGAGGYAQVRDTRKALAPLGRRVRFWGHQEHVAAAYRQIDYLLTGLPEKEAQGLNVLEAQACGTPVLAPAAPPFTETVLDGETGFLYADPRVDGGADFERLIVRLKEAPRPDPRRATQHLARFSKEALRERTRRLLEHLHTTIAR